MSTDPSALLMIATSLDRHADVLRARSRQVLAVTAQTCWSSPAAREWAADATGIASALAAGAELTERAAATFRRAADGTAP